MASFGPNMSSCFMLVGFFFPSRLWETHKISHSNPKVLKLSEKQEKRWPVFQAPFLKIQLFVKHIQHSLETLENNIWKLSHWDVMENSSPKLEHHPAIESAASCAQQSRTAIPGGHSNSSTTEHTVPGNGIIRDTLKRGEKFRHTRALYLSATTYFLKAVILQHL